MFDLLKQKISTTPIPTLLYLRESFGIQTNASEYTMGVVLMQHGKPIYFDLETFNGVVINYPTYQKELYALVQSVKKMETLPHG